MKKGFTLIELLAVIVVLAILALVVTPIVLNIVGNAQTGSDERSLEQYAKVMQTTYYEMKMEDTSLTLQDYLNDVDTEGISSVSLTYNGSRVECTEKIAVEENEAQTIELYECTVDGRGIYQFVNGKAEKVDGKVGKNNAFAKDSWETIKNNIKNKNTNMYSVGDTKEVDLGRLGKHTVRIANMSTPTECSTNGFSQTACGFVIEFVDIISKHNMKAAAADDSLGNGSVAGGWEYSDMRGYVNNDIYNALPTELKNIIIGTTVVSGHGLSSESNFTTTDNLYLLTPKEIYGIAVVASNGSPSDKLEETRQLDYYKKMNVTESNFSATIKKYNGVAEGWWLRTAAYHYVNFMYFGVQSKVDGLAWFVSSTVTEFGVSPAFRIG